MKQFTDYVKDSSGIIEQVKFKPEVTTQGSAHIEIFDKEGNLVTEAVAHNAISNIFGMTAAKEYYFNRLLRTQTGSGNYCSLLNAYGIMLMNTQSLESDDRILRSGETVGYSYAVSPYSGASLTRGTVNLAESTCEFNNGKIRKKFVFDFPTHAANGTFNALSWGGTPAEDTISPDIVRSVNTALVQIPYYYEISSANLPIDGYPYYPISQYINSSSYYMLYLLDKGTGEAIMGLYESDSGNKCKLIRFNVITGEIYNEYYLYDTDGTTKFSLNMGGLANGASPYMTMSQDHTKVVYMDYSNQRFLYFDAITGKLLSASAWIASYSAWDNPDIGVEGYVYNNSTYPSYSPYRNQYVRPMRYYNSTQGKYMMVYGFYNITTYALMGFMAFQPGEYSSSYAQYCGENDEVIFGYAASGWTIFDKDSKTCIYYNTYTNSRASYKAFQNVPLWYYYYYYYTASFTMSYAGNSLIFTRLASSVTKNDTQTMKITYSFEYEPMDHTSYL